MTAASRRSVRRPHVDVDLRPYYAGEERGHHAKTLLVLHETVSHDKPGVGDITGPAAFLDSAGYEIHAIVDLEGHSAWCYDPTAVYDHAASGRGRVNTRSIGIELVSDIPLERDPARRRARWDPAGPRRPQLELAARWAAWLNTTQGIPLRFSQADRSGITTHWNVSRTYNVPGGHWDCKPVHQNGHFPVLWVVQRARTIVRAAGQL